MNLRLELAGLPTAWRFRGSEGLGGWLAERPWATRSSVRAVLAPKRGWGPVFSDLVTAQVRVFDSGGTEVRVEPTPSGDARSAIGERLNITEEGRTAWLRRAAEELAYAPRVFIFDLSSEERAGMRLAELEDLADGIAKSPEGSRGHLVAIALLHGSEGALAKDDYSVGMPVDGASDLRGHDERSWSLYIHHRVAWECAGNPEQATEYDARYLAGMRKYDDDAFEEGLNRAADEKWRNIPTPSRAALLAELVRVTAEHRVSPRCSEALSRLFWTPFGERHTRLMPWFARAALLHGAAPPSVETLLRGSLLCAPLARALLSRCFDLELRVRGWFAAGSHVRSAPAKAEEYLKEFSLSTASGPRLLYPKGYPRLPSDAWAFASLGQLTGALDARSGLKRDALERLRLLRNALAHCHYVSWRAVEILTRVERELDS